MKKLISKIIRRISPKRTLKSLLKDGSIGTIIEITDSEYKDYSVAHAVSPTETGVCELEGCNLRH